MKAVFEEHDGCFAIHLTAESMEEAAVLVRFGMNRTDSINSCSTMVAKTGEFGTSVVLGKSKRADAYVPKRK